MTKAVKHEHMRVPQYSSFCYSPKVYVGSDKKSRCSRVDIVACKCYICSERESDLYYK